MQDLTSFSQTNNNNIDISCHQLIYKYVTGYYSALVFWCEYFTCTLYFEYFVSHHHEIKNDLALFFPSTVDFCDATKSLGLIISCCSGNETRHGRVAEIKSLFFKDILIYLTKWAWHKICSSRNIHLKLKNYNHQIFFTLIFIIQVSKIWIKRTHEEKHKHYKVEYDKNLI